MTRQSEQWQAGYQTAVQEVAQVLAAGFDVSDVECWVETNLAKTGQTLGLDLS